MNKLVDDFFRDNDLFVEFGFCILFGRIPCHAGSTVWFWSAGVPHITVTHCVLHRHELATKTLPPKLAEVVKSVVECANYAMKHRISKELCNEMGSEFEVLLYHSNVRWLSRGKVLNRVLPCAWN